MSVRWWPFIHRVAGTCLNFPYVFGVLGWAFRPAKKKSVNSSPIWPQQFERSDCGILLWVTALCPRFMPDLDEGRSYYDICNTWFILYAPNMPHAPMLHLPTVAFPNSWTSAIPTLRLRRVRDWRPEGPHQVQVPGHPRRFDPCRKTPHGHDVAAPLFLWSI